MNENNANLCEMEQEIFQIKDKYKPYFELEKEKIKDRTLRNVAYRREIFVCSYRSSFSRFT